MSEQAALSEWLQGRAEGLCSMSAIGKLSHLSDVGCVICWLSAASGEKEIAFKSLNTYYKAVTAGSADSWFLCGGVMLRDAEHAKTVVTKVRGGQTYLWFWSCHPQADGSTCCKYPAWSVVQQSAPNLERKAVHLFWRGQIRRIFTKGADSSWKSVCAADWVSLFDSNEGLIKALQNVAIRTPGLFIYLATLVQGIAWIGRRFSKCTFDLDSHIKKRNVIG